MIFKEKKLTNSALTGKRKLIKVDANNVPIPNEPEVLINIIRDEGTETESGTPLNAANLNKGNWRDDNSLSFASRTDNNLPAAKNNETQLVTKSNGEVWIVPPSGKGSAFNLNALSYLKKYFGADVQTTANAGTVLWSGSQDSGTITLSQSYQNFDTLYITTTWDNSYHWHTTQVPVGMLNHDKAKAASSSNPTFMLVAAQNYWSLKTTSTNTSLVFDTDNCRIREIRGIKFA